MTYRSTPSPQTPPGSANLAAEPFASSAPFLPAIPAIVIVSPVAIETRRITDVSSSATYKYVPSPQMPRGDANRAAEPTPSTLAGGLDSGYTPANVVTRCDAITILRIVEESVTYRFCPSPQIADGAENRAAEPTPS